MTRTAPHALAIPRVIGHRGVAAHAPENTLAGVSAAAAMGVTMVEFDAMLSADSVPMIIHDETVERTTDGRGAVAELTAAALGRLDAGARFAARFRGERVPTLEAMLAHCLAIGLAVNIEIKPSEGFTEATAVKVMEVALRSWPADRPPPLVSSFQWDALIVARELAPDWPRGMLIDDRPEDWADWLGPLAPATLNIGWRRLKKGQMADYRATGLPILVYTVNDADRARRLFADGVHGVFSDAPDRLAGAAPV